MLIMTNINISDAKCICIIHYSPTIQYRHLLYWSTVLVLPDCSYYEVDKTEWLLSKWPNICAQLMLSSKRNHRCVQIDYLQSVNNVWPYFFENMLSSGRRSLSKEDIKAADKDEKVSTLFAIMSWRVRRMHSSWNWRHVWRVIWRILCHFAGNVIGTRQWSRWGYVIQVRYKKFVDVFN